MSEDNGSSNGSGWLKKYGPWLAGLNIAITCCIGVVGAFSKYQVDKLERESTKQKSKIDSIASNEDVRKAESALTYQLYEEVKSSLLEKEPSMATRHQLMALTLVDQLASDPFKTSLIKVIGQASADPTIRSTAKLAIYFAEKSALPPKIDRVHVDTAVMNRSHWANLDFDFFWCESSGDSTVSAAQEAMSLLKDPGAVGVWRVRMLPKEINERQGHQKTKGYAIHFGGSVPQGVTTDLQDRLKIYFGTEFKSQTLQNHENTDRTPNPNKIRNPYKVSVYFCPDAG